MIHYFGLNDLKCIVWTCFLEGPYRFVLPENQQSSSIWKVGKEGGKCYFLLFDDQ